MQTTHQTALETKHAVLDQRIADEAHRPMPDPTILAGLKKQKLRLKEEIVSL
ncbi:YdcH family protein [Sphingomonas sp. R86520]|uniref:YdcH family protein n=1 Tax=Sphingomonas sp. R86520 TaxID=3093859 RepID=UPI0036D41090